MDEKRPVPSSAEDGLFLIYEVIDGKKQQSHLYSLVPSGNDREGFPLRVVYVAGLSIIGAGGGGP